MVGATLAPIGPGVAIGRVSHLSHDELARQQDVQRWVSCDNEGCTTLNLAGKSCPGQQADIKPDLHWLLVTKPDGKGYELQPISVWFNFERPVAFEEGLDDLEDEAAAEKLDSSSKKRKSEHLGEEGIKRDAWLRRHIDGRWQGMLERRAVQTGRWLDAATGSSRIREQILSDFHYSSDGLGPQVLSILKSVNKDLSVSRCLRELEGLEQMSFQQKQQVRTDLLQHPAQLMQMDWDTEGSILKSVAEHLKEKRLENRKMNARKRAKAKKGEDVEEVPETANTLKQLKSETGEALWDFEAADEFSDDQEEDVEEKHRELVIPDRQVLAPEEGATDSEDEGNMMSKHGQDLQVLLNRQKDPEDQDEDSQDDQIPASAKLRNLRSHPTKGGAKPRA
ncbi:unnamed protein product [Symbiodinium natans]|uniref:Uncharacterized protein n=1 Tax=Symbiodinium natans TaxID=878477 RepID=A0A812NU19_9DINO|nr:unnamed protein product [Symbiodinium natans]